MKTFAFLWSWEWEWRALVMFRHGEGRSACPRGSFNTRPGERDGAAQLRRSQLSHDDRMARKFLLAQTPTVQVLRLSLSLGSVTAVNLRRPVCGAQGSLDR